MITSTEGGERERPLPADVLSIGGKGGRPLVAKSKRAGANGRNPFLEIVGQTLLGAGRGIADEISSNATSVTTNGSTTSVQVDDEINLPGGAIGGASDSVLDLLESQRQIRGFSEGRSPAVRYWFAKAGTKVELVVNRSVPIYGS